MPTGKSLPDIVRDVYVLLEPLDSPHRKRVVDSVLKLLGEDAEVASPAPASGKPSFESGRDEGRFGDKANRWMAQNGLTSSAIEEVFHRDGSDVQIIASQVPTRESPQIG